MDARNDSTLQQQAITRSIAQQLSLDVLLSIFTLFREMYSDNIGILINSTGVLWDWLTVTRVCKRWREIALDYPGLWTDIRYFINTDKTRAFLERSKDAEIKVSLRLNFHTADTITSLLNRHMWRVRVFRVTVVSWGWGSVLPLLAELSERTEAVELQHEYTRRSSESDAWMLLNIPASIRRVKLASLSLRSVALPWSCKLYHGLSRLSVVDISRSITRPSIWQLKEILEHSSGLRYLSLIGVHPTCNATVVDSLEKNGSKIDLPLLEYVELINVPFSTCAYLSSIANLSGNARLSISIIDYPVHNPLPFPPTILNGQKECENLFIELSGVELTIQSNIDAISSATSISVSLPASADSRDAMASIAALLAQRYWETAENATLRLNCTFGIRLSAYPESLDIILDALPGSISRLRLETKHLYGYQRCRGRCVSSLLAKSTLEGLMRKPTLERVMIYDADFTTDLGRKQYREFLVDVKGHNKYARKPMEIRFSECKGISAESEEVIIVPA